MNPSQTSRVETATPVTHYENFPVASILCPAHLRPAVAAIYHFARTADDIFALLCEFNRDSHCACLIVTHDPRLAARCDRVIRLVDGNIADDLPTA